MMNKKSLKRFFKSLKDPKN